MPAAAGAATNALKSGSNLEVPSLPSPPSLPNPTEALKSTSDIASKVSLPEAPPLTSAGQDSTALQQVTVVDVVQIKPEYSSLFAAGHQCTCPALVCRVMCVESCV